MQENLAIALVRNTSILNISFSHASPEHAAMVANQVARSYIDQTVDKTSETSDLARQFIQEQVIETKAKLQESEAALVAYAKEAGITVTGSDASLISENISKINAALGQAIQDRLDAQRDVEQVRAGNASSLPQVFASESIQTTKQKIAELRATYQEKLNTLKPGFPEMIRLSSQIGELQKQVDAEVTSIARAVEIKFEQSKEKETALKEELAQLEAEQSTFQDKNIQYTILKREVDSNRSQYDTLINKLNEVGVGSELRSSNASIVDLAITPRRPYTPNLNRNLMFAMVLFAAFAAGIIYLLELMNNTFSVPDQIESELKLPVLGVIPFVDQEELHNAFSDNKSSVSEAYRSLRTSIQFTGTENAMRTILVTSSEPSEGKSS
ncbi:MAG: exopolysaccharide biosynthesis protein, partial [Pseudomonadota bacterium]